MSAESLTCGFDAGHPEQLINLLRYQAPVVFSIPSARSRPRFRKKLLGRSDAATLASMKFLDPKTESAVRAFLARLPADVRLDHAILYGSRARGEDGPDSDADVALIIAEGTADLQLVGTLAELAYEVFLESGILIQPVPVSLTHWRHPERFPRPGFLRNVARDGIVL